VIDALVTAFSGPGAPFMYAITAVGAFSLTVGVERFWMLVIRWKVNAKQLFDALENGTEADILACVQQSPLHPMLSAGSNAENAETRWRAMGAEAAWVEHTLSCRVGALASAGNIATMLGLLGTVYGLIVAFGGMTDTASVTRAVQISEGIATAMSTTAWGLIVGITSLALHTFIEGRVRSMLALGETAAARMVRNRS
jgi:biopolymer transport protein ExbB